MTKPDYEPNRSVVKRHPSIARDLKRLSKRYPSVERDLMYAERLLEAGQTLTQTYAYPGFGQRRLYKTRVVNTAIPSGKSKGYRMIYEAIVEQGNDGFLLVLLYDHSSYKSELEVRKEVRDRLAE